MPRHQVARILPALGNRTACLHLGRCAAKQRALFEPPRMNLYVRLGYRMDVDNTRRGGKTYGSENRLIVGNVENGGLADVNRNWHDKTNDNIGFRVLAVLYPVFFIHPPSIFPSSCKSAWRAKPCRWSRMRSSMPR